LLYRLLGVALIVLFLLEVATYIRSFMIEQDLIKQSYTDKP
jgi:hypothetical protein